MTMTTHETHHSTPQSKGARPMSASAPTPPPPLNRGTVLSVENIPATPGAHPVGPPPYYRWNPRHEDPAEELRRVHAIGASMGIAIFQAITGQRPLRQLQRWCEDDVIRKLYQRFLIEGDGSTPLDRSLKDHRSYRRPEIRPRRVRAVNVGPHEYELSVVLDTGPRCRAMALRVHKPRGQWRIVTVEIG